MFQIGASLVVEPEIQFIVKTKPDFSYVLQISTFSIYTTQVNIIDG